MRLPNGDYACTEDEILRDPLKREPDWTMEARCHDCPWFAYSPETDDWDAIRYRGEMHRAATGHRVELRQEVIESFDPAQVGMLA